MLFRTQWLPKSTHVGGAIGVRSFSRFQGGSTQCLATQVVARPAPAITRWPGPARPRHGHAVRPRRLLPAGMSPATRTVCVPEWVTGENRPCRRIHDEEMPGDLHRLQACSRNEDDPDGVHGDGPGNADQDARRPGLLAWKKSSSEQYTVMVSIRKPFRASARCARWSRSWRPAPYKDNGHWEEYRSRSGERQGLRRPCTARRACRPARTSVCRCLATACTTADKRRLRQRVVIRAADGNAAVQCVKKVWVPNIVQEQVEVTEAGDGRRVPARSSRSASPERTRKVRVREYQKEEKTREVQYTVRVPQQRTVTREVCRRVPAEGGHPNVQVPRRVEKAEVRVCKMVQKTVQVPCGPARTRSCARPARGCCAPKAACACAPCAGC